MSTLPNIVLILADDMGYGDVGVYDPAFNRVPTPNLDRLACEGMIFTDAHASSAVCTPSRYSILTGRYAWRTQLQKGVLGCYAPPLIAEETVTIGDTLKTRGYATACVGKWHLGMDYPRENDEVVFHRRIANGPTTRGFDSYFGTDVPNYPPYAFIENNQVVGEVDGWIDRDEELVVHFPGPGVGDWDFSQILPTITARATDTIRELAAGDRPYFLYFPLTTPHEPIAPSERFRGKSGICPVADLMMETDWAVGEVMQAIDQTGAADNTIVIFTTDNGHCTYTGLRPFEEAGHRVSGPFRGYKGDIWEGGHRVPFICRWPTTVAPRSRCSHTIGLVDLMATISDAAGLELPRDAGPDSISFVPLLRGEDRSTRSTSVYHSSKGYFAMFEGPWKLALCPGGGGFWSPDVDPRAPRMQLYNIRHDPAERENLIDRHPELAQRLLAEMEETVRRGRTIAGPPLNNDVEVDIWKRESNEERQAGNADS